MVTRINHKKEENTMKKVDSEENINVIRKVDQHMDDIEETVDKVYNILKNASLTELGIIQELIFEETAIRDPRDRRTRKKSTEKL